MHTDVSRAHFHAKAQRPVPVRLLAEDLRNNDAGKHWTVEEEHVRHA